MKGKSLLSVSITLFLALMFCMPVTSNRIDENNASSTFSEPNWPVLDAEHEVPTPQDLSAVYFAKTGAGIDHTPSIIQADNGTFFMAYEKGDATWHFTINVMWSPDGITWDQDITVASTGGTYGNRHPTLIQRQDGDLQVVYLTDRTGTFQIYTSISSNGIAWTEYGPFAVSGPAINPFIIQDENGNYGLSYQRYGASPSSRNGAYFASSSDGITWSAGTQVSTYPLPRLMKADGGNYFMTYQGGTTGVDFDIRYKTSSDGITWSSETRLTYTGNSHDSFPMQLANGTYMVFFATSLGGGGYDLYRKWSPDMSTWSADEYLETNNFRFDTEPHPCQIAGNQSFLLSWGYESSGTVGAYEDVDIALMWIEDITEPILPTADISLSTGWNMISLPLIPADTSIENVLSTIAGKYTRVKTYDAWAGSWKLYYPAGPASYSDLTDLDHKMGIWIEANQACTLTVSGTVPDITNISLKSGWNLVGYPSTVIGKNAALSLTGTDANMISTFQPTAPYVTDTTNLGSVTMTQEEAYWVHVPADTIWVVDNVPPPLPNPYVIFGYVQLYDGTSFGGYSPLASSGGAALEVEWYNPSIGDWDSMNVPVEPTGQFVADLPNTQDGGIVYMNATFDMPYGNRGYNYTIVDHMMGMSMQNVVCGVPYSVWMMQPMFFQEVMVGVPFMAEYWIVDMDGMLARGYFTFEDGPFEWFALAAFTPPPPRFFDGTFSMTPGIGTEFITFYDPGEVYMDVVEGPMGGNGYLTPWGEFYIDPENTMPIWGMGWGDDGVFVHVNVV